MGLQPKVSTSWFGESMSLLREIQAVAVSSDVSIADLLRRCRVLAVRLNNEEMVTWADSELNGYRNETALPAYRQTDVRAYGTFRPIRQRTKRCTDSAGRAPRVAPGLGDEGV